MAPNAGSHVLYAIYYHVKLKSLGLEISIEVSKLSIYREEDIKYITHKKIIFSVVVLLNICFCV